MRKLLIGSANPSKTQLMRALLQDLDVIPVSPAELHLLIGDAEDARTAEGNALQKALAWHRASRLPVLTEDSGLVFLDLPPDHPDQPGVWVRRATGHEMTDEEMYEWFASLAHRHGGRLRASWQDAWCLLVNETRYAILVDSPEELAQKAFDLLDHPVSDRVQPGWPLERLIVRSEVCVNARKLGRDHVRKWLQNQWKVL